MPQVEIQWVGARADATAGNSARGVDIDGSAPQLDGRDLGTAAAAGIRVAGLNILQKPP
uniref:Uncharacterized protein n=1 Tax=Setaria italica TaxID=4555 RepID=K4ANG2_SETIT